MKRLVVILTVVCILFAGVVGYMTYIDQPEKEAEPTAEPETTGTPEAEESAAPITVLTGGDEAFALDKRLTTHFTPAMSRMRSWLR